MKGPLVLCTLERIECDYVTGKDQFDLVGRHELSA